MAKLFLYLSISLLSMLAGFGIGILFVPLEFIPIGRILLLVLYFVFFLVVQGLRAKDDGKIRFSMLWVYLFTFIEGILLYPTLIYYLSVLGLGLFMNVVGGTFLIFLILSFVGVKKENGSCMKWGTTLFVLLLVLLIMSIINIFIGSEPLTLLLSIGGILLFSVYIMFDINNFKTEYENGWIEDSKDYSIHVLGIYLDIINLLLDLLRLVSYFKGDD